MSDPGRADVLAELLVSLRLKFDVAEGSAAAALSQQIRRTLVELEGLGKGESAGSGIDDLAGRRAVKKRASRTPARTAARKAAPRRKGKK